MRAVAHLPLDRPDRVWRLRSPSVSAYRSIVSQSPIHTSTNERFIRSVGQARWAAVYRRISIFIGTCPGKDNPRAFQRRRSPRKGGSR